MQPKTLRLRARGTAMVPHYEHLRLGVRRYIGRQYREMEPGNWGFAPTNEVEEVPNRAEYREAIRHGDAEAADEATAKACGVVFAPEAPAEPAPPSNSPKPEG